jgi:hypothetical protein
MVGHLCKGKSDNKYLFFMVDKFTNWIEAKPVATQEAEPVTACPTVLTHIKSRTARHVRSRTGAISGTSN